MDIKKLNEIIKNPELIFEDEGNIFLKNLKKQIKQNEVYVKSYQVKINNYNDYKKTKQDLKKLNEINALFKYIGKANIDSKINSIKDKIKECNYETNEKLEELNIKDELTEKICSIFKNKKASYFFENNRFCIITNEKLNEDGFAKYDPIIFSNRNYTKLILKEV